MKTAIREFSVDCSKEKLVQLAIELKQGDSQDVQTALLIMKMFEETNPRMCSELGDCFYQEIGVSKNISKALEMFKIAAGKGSVRAQYDLGWYYYDKDEYLRSIEHFSECIKHSEELDEVKMGYCHCCIGDAYTKISEPNFRLAIENLAIAADKYHDGYACGRLSKLYDEEETQYVDFKKARRYCELGVSYGEVACAHILAFSYINGNEEWGIEIDGRRAESILMPFESGDNKNILTDLGLLYQKGDESHGVKSDLLKSKKYYEKAWLLYKTADRAADLGYIYFCLNQYKEAEQMLLIADSGGCYAFSDFLGRIYKEGLAGLVDLEKAVLHYGKIYGSKDMEFNNPHTNLEYVEILIESGNYQKAYKIAHMGAEKYKIINFLYWKAYLILNGMVTNKESKEEAVEMMDICICHNDLEGEAHMEVGKYFASIGEYRKAEKRFMDSFSAGFAEAGVGLGYLYENGGGTIKSDANKAFEWFSKAANAGSNLGKEEVLCFKKGIIGGYRRIRSL